MLENGTKITMRDAYSAQNGGVGEACIVHGIQRLRYLLCTQELRKVWMQSNAPYPLLLFSTVDIHVKIGQNIILKAVQVYITYISVELLNSPNMSGRHIQLSRQLSHSDISCLASVWSSSQIVLLKLTEFIKRH